MSEQLMQNTDTDNAKSLTLIVRHIATIIESRIISEDYASNQWLPTERALAEEFRVSRPTIRQVLVELEERRLVMRSAGSRPIVCPRSGKDARSTNGATHSESASKRISIGLWISGDPTDMGGAMTAQGIHEVLDADVFRLVVANHAGETLNALIESESEALRRFSSDRDIAGLILWYFGDSENLNALRTLRAANIPLVFVDRRPPATFPADYVGVHNELAARTVVQHLLDLGHRRIAHITNSEPASSVVERREGYRRALASRGIPFDPQLILTTKFMEHGSIQQTAAGIAEQIRTMPNRPTALFAVNDYTAQFLIAALRAIGLRVPEDISVAGFDDEERLKAGEPFLTTVRQPFQTMGAEAAGLLLQRIAEGPTDTYCHTLLEAPLIMRGSTQPVTL